MLTIRLPFKIISKSNNYKKGKRSLYKPKDVHNQEDLIKTITLEACREQQWTCSTTPVKVTIHCHYKDKRRRDLDNVLKLILDAFNKILYVDDSLIYELHVYKHLGSVEETIVTISSLS